MKSSLICLEIAGSLYREMIIPAKVNIFSTYLTHHWKRLDQKVLGGSPLSSAAIEIMEARPRLSELTAEQLLARAQVYRTMAADAATATKDELNRLADRFEGLAAKKGGLAEGVVPPHDDQWDQSASYGRPIDGWSVRFIHRSTCQWA
jgi:hypothetical protein